MGLGPSEQQQTYLAEEVSVPQMACWSWEFGIGIEMGIGGLMRIAFYYESASSSAFLQTM